MPYQKQTWANGEKVTAAKLNHLEEGIYKSNILYVTIFAYFPDPSPNPSFYSDTSFAEVEEAIQNGRLVVFVEDVIGSIPPIASPFTKPSIGSVEWEYHEELHEIILDDYLIFNSNGITNDGDSGDVH